MHRCTELEFEAQAGDPAEIHYRVVEDAVTDAALRQFDREVNEHEVVDRKPGPFAAWFVPGTVIEVRAVRDDVPGPARRVIVGEVSPQVVLVK